MLTTYFYIKRGYYVNYGQKALKCEHFVLKSSTDTNENSAKGLGT